MIKLHTIWDQRYVFYVIFFSESSAEEMQVWKRRDDDGQAQGSLGPGGRYHAQAGYV